MDQLCTCEEKPRSQKIHCTAHPPPPASCWPLHVCVPFPFRGCRSSQQHLSPAGPNKLADLKRHAMDLWGLDTHRRQLLWANGGIYCRSEHILSMLSRLRIQPICLLGTPDLRVAMVQWLGQSSRRQSVGVALKATLLVETKTGVCAHAKPYCSVWCGLDSGH